MKPTISFLIGSGFSIPDGVPSVEQLNKSLAKINESEIIIASSQIAFFLKGQTDNNRFTNNDSRLFVQEFLQFYNTKILCGESFNYETFFDFYSGYLNGDDKNKKVIEGFYNNFNKIHFNGRADLRDCHNRIADFNRTFSQLLSSLLGNSKYYQNISWGGYTPYDRFTSFLEKITKTHEVKIHSLNHDLLFDFIGRVDTNISKYFSNGYEFNGSPFYGRLYYEFNSFGEKIEKSYMVKIARFTDKFDTPIAFFKLHGSIDMKIVFTGNTHPEIFRVKQDYAVSDIYIEMLDPITNKYSFEVLGDRVEPDFLSGTTTKMLFYQQNPYYNNLFKHFENNLNASELLIVIGYGFRDIGINDYLEKYYLSKEKEIIVISPSKAKCYLFDKYNIKHINKGVTELTFKEYMDLLSQKVVA